MFDLVLKVRSGYLNNVKPPERFNPLSVLGITLKIMSKTSAFHSVKGNVYHDSTKCTEGNNIEKENLKTGTGGKPKCAHCEKLS